jgi:hypothetical protein
MKTQMINVPVEFVIDALDARYNDVKDQWGCEAAHELWEQALDLVKECGLGCSSASEYVDNYLINGEFVSKEDVMYWRDETLEEYEDIDEAWEEFCQDNALIYNDEYACLQF